MLPNSCIRWTVEGGGHQVYQASAPRRELDHKVAMIVALQNLPRLPRCSMLQSNAGFKEGAEAQNTTNGGLITNNHCRQQTSETAFKLSNLGNQIAIINIEHTHACLGQAVSWTRGGYLWAPRHWFQCPY